MDGQEIEPVVFNWCELLTSDVEAAKAFYSKLFGWKIEPFKSAPDSPPYNVINAGSKGIGGIMSIPAGCGDLSPCWGAYVAVKDVDATVRAAERLGGRLLLPPRDIPTVGRICVIADPQGARLNVIAPSMG